jgi:L-lactate utilization protein LutB
MDWSTLANDESINTAKAALEANNVNVVIVDSAEDAKKKVLEIIPTGAEVMTATSETLTALDIVSELNDSGKYASVKTKLMNMDRETQSGEMQKLGAAPEWIVGSVHAVTEDGKVVVASNTGSQLPGYTYGAQHVIWVVGTQKLTKNLDDAMKRVYDYVLPLESERAHKAYGVPGSFVSKLFILNRETAKNRITLVFVKEKLGF